MIRLGWFCPVSSRTGIGTYSRNVLAALKQRYGPEEIDVVVCHPPTDDPILEPAYPRIEITDAFLDQDFGAMFDVIVYHLGNNEQHHGPIFNALLRVPGVVVLHDFVYQHYLASLSYEGAHTAPPYSALVHEVGGPEGFEVLSESGVLKCDAGKSAFVPWESEWAVQTPMSDLLAQLGLGAIVHSDYAASVLGDDYPGTQQTLFMPRPDEGAPQPISAGKRVHIVAGGHIQATKGLSLLVSAFTRDPSLAHVFDVTIAGFGTDRTLLARLRHEVKLAALDGTIRFEVNPPEAVFLDVMRSADIFYNLRFPNTEGASLSLSEQLGMGRPPIAYRTGSFAEMPEDACYFLDKIGDLDELTDLLRQIAADPAGVAQRGAAAWAHIGPKTAAAYAEGLYAYLAEHQGVHSARRKLGGFRTNAALPAPQTDADAQWLSTRAHAQQVLSGYFAQSRVIPSNLMAGSDLEIGRFVSLGLTEARMAAPRLERLGAFLRALPTVRRMGLIGMLYHLARQADGHAGAFLPRNVLPIPVVQADETLWHALALLDPHRAAQLGLAALSAEIDDDSRHNIAETAAVAGFAPTMRHFLARHSFPAQTQPQASEIIAVLGSLAIDGHRPLAASPLGQNLPALWRSQSPTDPQVLLLNFHRIEAPGIWSSHTQSAALMRVEDGTAVRSLTGRAMTIPRPDLPPHRITMRVEEIATGRHAIFSHTAAPGSANPFDLFLNVDGFTGTIRVDFTTPHLREPEGETGDQRSLGLMLQQLTLWPTPLKG